MTQDYLVYIGTYTGGGSEGVYVYRLDMSSGALKYLSVATGLKNPSFLAIDPERRNLYAVNEASAAEGQPTGAVSAFSIDAETGELTALNSKSTKSNGPCHLSVDNTGRYVLAANYTGGGVTVLPVETDGRLGEASDFVQHEGSSVNPERQQEPHPHSVFVDPGNRYAIVPDLGQDKVMVYKLDLSDGRLVPNEQPWTKVEPGAGPRHFDFHPNRRYAYVINEIGNTITAFAYDEASGTLEGVHSVSTLPDDFDGESYTADIHVSPGGRFVYGSNRGHDSIVIFGIDENSGRLTYVGHESTQGESPRNFAIDPTGTFLLAANQDTGTIVTFRIDSETGRLAATGQVAEVSMPVCLKLIPAP